MGWAEIHRLAMLESEESEQKELRATAVQLKVDMHVTGWAATQKEDLELEAALEWLTGQKKDDLKTLLAKHATEEEGWMLFCQLYRFTSRKGVFYMKSIGEDGVEELSLFVVPKVHQIAVLNVCH